MSDRAFSAAIEVLLRHEGSYSDDPKDRGNWTGGAVGVGELKGTNFGISAARYPGLDIEHLAREQAVAIWRRDWWEKYGYARLPDLIAIKTFDLAGNVGPSHAHKILQFACGACGIAVRVDGALGDRTVAAAGAVDGAELLDEIRHQAELYYEAIARAHPDDARFLKGWLARAED